jgi:hypothetical protein
MNGFIYVITNDNHPGLVKIGITRNVQQRFKQLQVQQHNIVACYECVNYDELEKQLHHLFKSRRLPQSEWFSFSDDELQQLAATVEANAHSSTSYADHQREEAMREVEDWKERRRQQDHDEKMALTQLGTTAAVGGGLWAAAAILTNPVTWAVCGAVGIAAVALAEAADETVESPTPNHPPDERPGPAFARVNGRWYSTDCPHKSHEHRLAHEYWLSQQQNKPHHCRPVGFYKPAPALSGASSDTVTFDNDVSL